MTVFVFHDAVTAKVSSAPAQVLSLPLFMKLSLALLTET